MASAALRGADTVAAGDLRVAVALAIAPRVTVPLTGDRQPPPPPPPPPPPKKDQKKEDEDTEAGEEEGDEEQEEGEQEEETEQEDLEVPEALVFAPEESAGALDPKLMLMFAHALQRKPGRAGRAKKNVVFSLDRGRYVKQGLPDVARHIIQHILNPRFRC